MTVLVIIGSTRPMRVCPQIAAWVAEIGRGSTGLDLELVDLKAWPLPMDDEPDMPQRGVYANDHTRAWSAKVAGAAAVVFVTPQYNWGYPAPLKNAIDHLYQEWSGKPAMVVTYGGRGGGKCAAQLREVLEGVHMIPVATMPCLVLPRTHIEANAGEIDPAAEFADAAPIVEQAFAELKAALA